MADRATAVQAEVLASEAANARATAVQAETLLSTGGPVVARATAVEAEAMLVTGPAHARTTSVVLEALISIASHAPGWVCVIE